MIREQANKYRIILASKSPRRQQLLKALDVPFEVITREVSEKFPEDMDPADLAGFIAEKKADAFRHGEFGEKSIIITADTVVLLNGEPLAKPENKAEAVSMLKKLSGKKHEVLTGVCLLSERGKSAFTASTDVWFKDLTDDEIIHYVERYNPVDKAGAYGIQEWIGYIGVTRIEGSYFNVMGLPVQQLYQELLKIFSEDHA